MAIGIRTVMVTTPAMLRDLIKQLAIGRVELHIIAEFDARRALTRRLKAIRPDLVVIGLRHRETDAVIRTMLLLLPATKFITFSSDGRKTLGFELRLYQTELGDASPNTLIDFIRSCASGLKG